MGLITLSVTERSKASKRTTFLLIVFMQYVRTCKHTVHFVSKPQMVEPTEKPRAQRGFVMNEEWAKLECAAPAL